VVGFSLAARILPKAYIRNLGSILDTIDTLQSGSHLVEHAEDSAELGLK